MPVLLVISYTCELDPTTSAERCVLLRLLIAVSEFACHSPNTTTCHHRLGDDSRLRLALAAQNKHTIRKYNISARVPGGNGGIWAHFFFFPSLQKVRQNYISTPGLPSGYVLLTCCMLVLCCECQAKA